MFKPARVHPPTVGAVHTRLEDQAPLRALRKGARTVQQSVSVFDEFVEEHRSILGKARVLRDILPADGASPVPPGFPELCERASSHLREEEEVLLPILARCGADLDCFEPVMQMLVGHARLRRCILRLSGEVARGDMRPPAAKKLAHELARAALEEKRIYRFLEGELPSEALEEISERLSARRNLTDSAPGGSMLPRRSAVGAPSDLVR